MKKILSQLLMFFLIITSYACAQTLKFEAGSYGGDCGFGGFGDCDPQPNYDVAANTSTGRIFLIKKEYNGSFTYEDKIIKFDPNGSRISESVLPHANYRRIVTDQGSGAYVLSERNDSVIVTRYNQSTLAVDWSTAIASAANSPEAFDICIAFGYIYFGFNDSAGLHLYKLNKSTGTVITFIDYNTAFFSYEHGLDIEASSAAIFVAGYLDEPGTLYGDEMWFAKFTSALTFSYEKYYNKNYAFTNNKDRASHVHISRDTIYVSGTATNTTGNVDAVVVKYSHNGNYQWIKTVHKGVLDHTVDCDIDNTNGDVYLLQNAFVNTDKIYVTRFNAAGDLKWTKVYSANDTISTATIGKNIHVDPNPGGGGCEIYVTGQREVYGSDPHGHVDGLNIIAFKYNRSGVRTVFYSPGLAGSIAPLISNTKSVYYSNYQGHPNLFIIGDGDYSNPTPGTYGWKLISFNINSTARMQSDAEMTSAVQNLKLYPNPASENVTLIADDQMETIQLYNTSGQLVKEIKGSTEYASFSVDDLPNGYYVVKVISKTVVSFTSLVVN